MELNEKNTNNVPENGQSQAIQVVEKQKVKEKDKIGFYRVVKDRDDNFKGFDIKLVELSEFIRDLGFCRHDLGNESYLFVHVKDKIVRQVDVTEITDAVINKVDNSTGCKQVTPKMVKEKLYGNLDRYFGARYLKRVKSEKPFDFVRDTKNKAFFCFRNGVVVVTKDGYELKPYSDFDQHIWKEQIIDKDFEPLNDISELLTDNQVVQQVECPFIDNFGNFARYCYKLSGDSERFTSLCSLIGYAIHNYTEYKLHAVVLTDSTISEDDESNGRSGKSLLFKSLQYIRNLSEILGKDFDPSSKHKYDKANIGTQIVFIDDLKRNFDVESLFNDITEGIIVDKKNQQPFKINPKIVLTSNKVLKIDGSSARDRFIEFEVTDFFNIDHTPEMEFGQWFFRDWNSEEWNKYFNFMLFCVALFLKNGIKRPEAINIDMRRLIQETKRELVIFLDEKVNNDTLKPKYEKLELYNEFVTSFGDFYKLTQRTFTQWVRKYMNLSPLYKSHYSPYAKSINEPRSNGTDYFVFNRSSNQN